MCRSQAVPLLSSTYPPVLDGSAVSIGVASHPKRIRRTWYVSLGYKVLAGEVVFCKELPAGFVLLYSTLLKSLPLTLYPPL
jgi:hypothetical protein